MPPCVDPGEDWGRNLTFVGRRRELRVLCALLNHSPTALILGPKGIGKKRLVLEAAGVVGGGPARVQSPSALRDCLEVLLPLLSPNPVLPEECRRVSSLALQARVLEALRVRPAWIWIDAPLPADVHFYRFLQRVVWTSGCRLTVTALSRSELGFLSRLLWDPREEISLRPLRPSVCRQLLEEAIQILQMEEKRGAALRERLPEAAGGNPGRLITLCRLASQSQYWRGDQLLWAPLWIDMLSAMS